MSLFGGVSPRYFVRSGFSAVAGVLRVAHALTVGVVIAVAGPRIAHIARVAR
jgi:hypothetical protein